MILTDAALRADLRSLWGSEGKAPAKMELLMRVTRDGYKNDVFHKLCDGKGATLVVIKGAKGGVFGGFTSVPWHTMGTYSSDPQAFLFALRGPHAQTGKPLKLLPTTRPEHAVRGHSGYGAFFGTPDLYTDGDRGQFYQSNLGAGKAYAWVRRAQSRVAHPITRTRRPRATARAFPWTAPCGRAFRQATGIPWRRWRSSAPPSELAATYQFPFLNRFASAIVLAAQRVPQLYVHRDASRALQICLKIAHCRASVRWSHTG